MKDTVHLVDENLVVRIGRGPRVEAVSPADGFEPDVTTTWGQFAEMMSHHLLREQKNGPYVCRPMLLNGGHRSDANAGPSRLFPLDIDEVPEGGVEQIKQWVAQSGYEAILTSTFSHTAEAPRLRLWVVLDREIPADEHSYFHYAFTWLLNFKTDPTTARASQPIFVPACPKAHKEEVIAERYRGRPIPVDQVLHTHKIHHEQFMRAGRSEQIATGERLGVRVAQGTVDYFSRHYDIRPLLEKHNYKRTAPNRYLAPGSQSGNPAVIIYPDGDPPCLISFHNPAHDKLARQGRYGNATARDYFDAYCCLEHNNNFKQAFASALVWNQRHGWKDQSAEEKPPEEDDGLVFVDPLNLLDHINATHSTENHIVQGVLQRKHIAAFTGVSGAGKSTVLEWLLVCIASGSPFAGRVVVKGKVVLVAGEDQIGFMLRYLALCDKHGIDHKSLQSRFLILNTQVQVLDGTGNGLVSPSLASFHAGLIKRGFDDIALMLFDTKSILSGIQDENSNDENAAFVRVVRQEFAERYGCAVMFTHHLTKDIENPSPRGASSFINNIDLELRIEPMSDSMVRITQQTKCRMARWPGPIHFQIQNYPLDAKKYPKLNDPIGGMPAPPIPVFIGGTTTKRTMKQQWQDFEFAHIIAAHLLLENDPQFQRPAHKGKKQLRSELLGTKMLVEHLHPKVANQRQWVKTRLITLIQDKLLSTGNPRMVTDAGREFLKQQEALGPNGQLPALDELDRYCTTVEEAEAAEEMEAAFKEESAEPRMREPGEDDE